MIGPKGKVINQIQDDSGANISIEEDGTIFVGASSGEAAEAARQMINAIANPTMPEKGERYLGTVVKLTTFGAFVSLLPGKDGLLHISKMRQLNNGHAVENVEDVVSVARSCRWRSATSTTAASCPDPGDRGQGRGQDAGLTGNLSERPVGDRLRGRFDVCVRPAPTNVGPTGHTERLWR